MTKSPSLDDLRIDRSDENESRVSPRLVVTFVVLLGLAAIGLWWILRPRVPVVEVAPVRQVAVGTATGAVLDASGYVTARRRATVSSKVTAKVEEVLVEEGMAVEEGQVLARLDDATQTRLLALAQAELEAARRAVKETQVRREEAKLNLDRAKNLLDGGVIGASDLDAARATFDALGARREVEQQQVKVAQRRMDLRRQELEDTVIRAPFTGVAITKDAQPGEMISPVSAGGGFTRTGICSLVDMSSLEIEVDVNETYINRVQTGQKVQATLDAYPQWKIPAYVITTVPAADRQKATVRVRIGFEKDEGLLDPRILPDMGIKVSFLDEELQAETAGQPVMLIPEGALRKDGEQDVVYVLVGEAVERHAVQIGGSQGKDLEVIAGVSAGERVIVVGPEELADGDAVRLERSAR